MENIKINTDDKLVHYPFPSIGQFSNVIYNVNNRASFVGLDADNEPIYDKCLPKPNLKFVGTVKMHGTNAGIIFDFHNSVVYYQSRENVITPFGDNAGCATYLSSIQNEMVDMVLERLTGCPIDWEKNVFAIWGEWCGGSIQKGIALNQLEKMFVIFDVAVVNKETKQKSRFDLETISKYKLPEKKIYNIYDYEKYEMEIDFNEHYNANNKLIELTIGVEDMCPVGKAFGVEGIGEGIVFRCVTEGYLDSGFWFKSKGEKHANKSKVKTVRAVDNDKLQKLLDLADAVTPSWRLEQIFNLTFDTLNGGTITREKLGAYLKAMNGDVAKEETQRILDAGVEFKELVPHIGKITRDYFFMMEKDFMNGTLVQE